MYLWFFDDSKKSIDAKICDAVAAYQARFHTLPTVALVSEADNAPARVAGVVTRVERRIARNNIHVGVE